MENGEFEEAVKKACQIERPEWQPWGDLEDCDPNEGDPSPELRGTHSLEQAVKCGRCGHPMRVGDSIRWCTGLPMSRMGRGSKHTGRFCRHHKDSEPSAKDLDLSFREFHWAMVEGRPDLFEQRADFEVEA